MKKLEFKFGCPNCKTNFSVSKKSTMEPFFPRYCPACGYDASPNPPVNPLALTATEAETGGKGGFAIGGYDAT